jgi:hypothetical protein
MQHIDYTDYEFRYWLETRLSKVAKSRGELVRRFPHDAFRNERASAALNKLAGRVSELTNDDWLNARPYFDPESPRWQEAFNSVSRTVGFTQLKPSLRFFLSLMLVELRRADNVAA